MKNTHIKTPISKPQPPEKFQVPNFKSYARAKLELGPWSFSGAWMLVLGALLALGALNG
jgi:hypothetical protein